ncbi:transcriptional regulator [Salipaludibacillus sp. CUR1]|uniref:transcriptional regulator n=1 Tax=Salipaludibacillus sp. CUR1 TaxID=2820003 RepID=UPI001E63B861|nr:transcriptional regulator [Salipaludibacillus sp. CUR1]MCE7792297.1 transcriptional regulator [Salipaludibacillus sp. CUR1]
MKKLRELETFSSVSNMDEFVSEALEVLEIKELDRSLLRLLAGYSCKFIGVSFMKVQTMADKLEVSYKTTQRALKRLKDIGVIQRVRQLREVSGGFGSSLTIIRPIELTDGRQASKPVTEGAEEGSPKRETFYLKAYKKDIKYIRHQEELDYSYLSEFIPAQFIDTVKPFVKPEEALSLWSKAQVVARKYAPSVVDIIEPAIRSFKATVMAYKTNRIKNSFGGYFWGALSGVFSTEQRRAVSSQRFNWLEE